MNLNLKSCKSHLRFIGVNTTPKNIIKALSLKIILKNLYFYKLFFKIPLFCSFKIIPNTTILAHNTPKGWAAIIPSNP